MGREDEVLKVERRKISELKNDPANARKHSPRNLKAIRDSLDVFGQQKPIVVDSRGVVIAGNGTLEAARELGWGEIDVAVTDLDPAHAQAFGIADNRTAELAEWDTDVLGQLLEGMDSDLADILSIDDLELPDSIDGGEQGEGLTDPDEVPEPPEEPITQTGDLWLLGEHRLLCGDSTSAEDVGRLMDGAVAGIMITDPPYGVEYDADWRNHALRANGSPIGGRAVGKVSNDDRADWSDAWKLYAGDVVYIWSSDKTAHIVAQSIIATGFSIISQIIWAKNQLVIGRGNYHPKHEPCWYAVKEGGKRNFTDDRTQTTLWEINKPHKSETGHSTQKPIECMARPLKNHSFKTVYDPFLGSGTTLIAAEQLGRKCYGMEIDPKYCDVIVKRWEDFTGQTATRENERT
mgnify:CR=1 FL=1